MNSIQKFGFMLSFFLILIVFLLHNPFGGYYHLGNSEYYSRPTTQKLLYLWRDKFPQYNEVSDIVLENGINRKYPEFVEEYYQVKKYNREEFISKYSDKLPIYEETKIYSENAVSRLIDEKSELIGFIITILVFGSVWIYIFKKNE
ncbi:hypothetical protein ACFL0J_04420 [Candidatus Neomarinimicrobiota bacterium]